MTLSYSFITIICNIINTYILYKYYNYLFHQKRLSKYTEILAYLAYFLLNTLIYFFINIPVVTLSTNLLAFFLIAFIYESKGKQKVFAAIFYCLSLMLVESAVVFVTTTSIINIFGHNDYVVITGQIFTTIFMYLLVEIVGRKRNINNQADMPVSYWILLLITPFCSFIIMLYLMAVAPVNERVITICCLLFMFVNISTFYLYSKIFEYITSKAENKILEQQNIYYDNLLKTIKTSAESARRLNHDINNHIVVMQALLMGKKYEELSDYFEKIYQEAVTANININSGNTTIDSILNFKMQECTNKKIMLIANVAVPADISIHNTVLTIILGNLLDNAIEATSFVEDNRVISLKVIFEYDNLFIICSNPYIGTIQKKGNAFLTSKANKDNHGFGINNIKTAVEDHGGMMTINYDNQQFKTKIILYADTLTAEFLPK